MAKRTLRSFVFVMGVFTLGLEFVGCSDGNGSIAGPSGGTQGVGGATLGGSSTTGTSGGSTSPADGTGGTASTAVTTGGTNATTGGAKATGGTPTAATGGSKATGGMPTAGGGATSTGGTPTAGGATSTGGTTGAGGNAGSAGLPALHTEGPAIKDPNGRTIVLRGASLPDIGTLWAYSSQSSAGITARIDKLTEAGMTPHVIRFPVYPRTCFNTGGAAFNSPAPFPIGTAGGTQTALTNDEYVTKILKPAVDYATNKGMYVIIDYHQIDNTSGQSAIDATTFWTYMAAKFASYTNVLYEPYNEPVDTSTNWATFKTRAQAWVDAIRTSAPNNIVIVPSMNWDQKPGDAATSPLTGTNLAYTAHVYPGNWNAAFKQQVATAVAKVPVFFTEWGYILNGSDQNLGTSSATWGSDFRTLVDGNGVSWTAWVADNSWTPNLFSNTALTTLTDFGTLTKTWLTATAGSNWVQ